MARLEAQVFVGISRFSVKTCPNSVQSVWLSHPGSGLHSGMILFLNLIESKQLLRCFSNLSSCSWQCCQMRNIYRQWISATSVVWVHRNRWIYLRTNPWMCWRTDMCSGLYYRKRMFWSIFWFQKVEGKHFEFWQHDTLKFNKKCKLVPHCQILHPDYDIVRFERTLGKVLKQTFHFTHASLKSVWLLVVLYTISPCLCPWLLMGLVLHSLYTVSACKYQYKTTFSPIIQAVTQHRCVFVIT